jgi:hypothetical protein
MVAAENVVRWQIFAFSADVALALQNRSQALQFLRIGTKEKYSASN